MNAFPADSALALANHELQTLQEVQQMLLTPPRRVADADAWSRHAGRLLGALFDAPQAAVSLTRTGLAAPPVFPAAGSFASWLGQAAAALSSTDTHPREAFFITGPPADPQLAACQVLAEDAFPCAMGFYVAGTYCSGALGVAFEKPQSPLFGVSGLARLGLLLPLFRACVTRSQPLMPGPLSLFEKLGEPLAVYDGDGAELCRSRAFRRLLKNDDDAGRVCEAASALATAVCLHAATDGAVPAPVVTTHILRTTGARYELHGSPLPAHLLSVPAALIHLRRSRPRLPAPAQLRTRLGLTTREAEVALLVAEGLTSKEIAQRLSLSANTVRRHGEKVLEKLGLHARSGVALALMREG